MKQIVLLGDSVFDNGAYVGSQPDVVRQTQQMLPPGWKAFLSARDGAAIADIESQISKLPDGTTHLVLSVGGNDALRQSGALDASVDSVANALSMLNTVRENSGRHIRGCSTSLRHFGSRPRYVRSMTLVIRT